MRNASTDPPVGIGTLLRRVWQRLFSHGPAWILARIAREVSVPTTWPGGLLRYIAMVIPRAGGQLRRIFQSASETPLLLAFYDLQVQPPTFDFLWFLTGAELERRRLGLAGVHIVVVPDSGSMARSYPGANDQERFSVKWRLENIVVPSIGFLESGAGSTICHDRSQAKSLLDASDHVYPVGYRVGFPVPHNPGETIEAGRAADHSVAILRSSDDARHYVSEWLADRAKTRKVVSITLREYAEEPDRNSNVEAWATFARRIQDDGYFPVIIRDTGASLAPEGDDFQGLTIFAEAAWNISLRMAFYEICYLNMGVNNGPAGLCWLNEHTRYLTFKMIRANERESSEAAFRVRGMKPYATLPFSTPFQKWIWEEDSLEILDREFRDMVDRITADADG